MTNKFSIIILSLLFFSQGLYAQEGAVSLQIIYVLIFLLVLLLLITFFINNRLVSEIKKRKSDQDLLKLTINAGNLGTWKWYPKTNVCEISDSWLKKFGLKSADITNINDFFSYVHEDDIVMIEVSFENYLKTKKEFFDVDLRLNIDKNNYKWIHLKGSVINFDDEHKANLVLGVLEDITKRKVLEEEVLKQKDLIISQSRQVAMGEMLENIAHQWRQPLSVITTIASGVKINQTYDMLDEKELLSSMDEIISSSKYLSDTIEDFRNYTNRNKSLTIFDVNKLIENSTKYVKKMINNDEIELVIDVENARLKSYESDLMQCLINIINNSVDALNKLEGKKLIVVHGVEDEEFYNIKIMDNAGGIDNEIINKIFEPYFTTKHKAQGTGIGLYMTKELIEKTIEGFISVKNEKFLHKNKIYYGAVFSIKIPKSYD